MQPLREDAHAPIAERPLGLRLAGWLARRGALGPMLLFWALSATLFGGIALLAVGLVRRSSWWFLGGLLCGRLFLWLCQVSDALMEAGARNDD